MSWKLGSKSTSIAAQPVGRLTDTCAPESKDTKENGVVSRSVTPIPSRSATPRPPDMPENTFRSGMLTIRIFSGAPQSPSYDPSIVTTATQAAASRCPRACRYLR